MISDTMKWGSRLGGADRRHDALPSDAASRCTSTDFVVGSVEHGRYR